jgi:tripartite-type tricarboxylate transporter receptor subunit TctC
LLSLAMAAGNLAATSAAAHAWPAKPMRLVAPFSVGSELDTMMRAMQNELSVALGQPIVIEPPAGPRWSRDRRCTATRR